MKVQISKVVIERLRTSWETDEQVTYADILSAIEPLSMDSDDALLNVAEFVIEQVSSLLNLMKKSCEVRSKI